MASKERTYNSKENPLRPESPDDPVLDVALERWTSFRRAQPYGTIKTGYMTDPEDGCHLVPDRHQIFFIEQAFDYLQAGNTLRETSEWLSQKLTGLRDRPRVSHQTLSNLYNEYRKPHTFFKTQKKEGPTQSRSTRKLIGEGNKARAAVRRYEKLEAENKLKKNRLKDKDWDKPREIKVEEIRVFAESENEKRLNILFQPNPGPQTEFLAASEQEILYGGSAGGEDKVFLLPPFLVTDQNKTRELLECPKGRISSQAFAVR